MELSERIEALAELGYRLESLPASELEQWELNARALNKWFTESNILKAMKGIRKMLFKDDLKHWIEKYTFPETQGRTIGLVLAGNIPFVGFHDVLAVLISGNKAEIKLSSQDSFLMSKLLDLLVEIEPRFNSRIIITEKLSQSDAYIATGSDNTSRYFEYYFSKKPNIIRRNRTSVAVLNGKETDKDLIELGQDIFSYFGLGCRNISKVFLPEDFEPEKLIKGLESYSYVVDHSKYANNYEYNRAIFLLKNIPYLDNGFCIFKEDEGIVSPISVLYYEFYSSEKQLKTALNEHKEKIQVITSADGWWEKSVPFGKAQEPELYDYADNVDTLRFLTALT